MKSFYIIASTLTALAVAAPVEISNDLFLITVDPTSTTSSLVPDLPPAEGINTAASTKNPRNIYDLCLSCSYGPFPADTLCAVDCLHRNGRWIPALEDPAELPALDLDGRPFKSPDSSDLEQAEDASEIPDSEQPATAGLFDGIFGSCHWPLNFFFGCTRDKDE
ncbi:hypothetical protein N0V95_009695 [Ascochyta clinopodiicola]|nr:hypothetical protein N0V95_009695 [Ascochyta clinopodiicola]